MEQKQYRYIYILNLYRNTMDTAEAQSAMDFSF